MTKHLLLILISTALLMSTVWAHDFGDGSDGALSLTGSLVMTNPVGSLKSDVAGGSDTLVLAPLTGTIVAGDEILILTTMSATDAGKYEFADVQSVTVDPGETTVTLVSPTTKSFPGSPSAVTLVVEVKNYTTVSIGPSANLTAKILAFRATEWVIIDGTVSATGRGHNGAFGDIKMQGDSWPGTGDYSTLANGGGGGGGENVTIPPGGGGAGYATAGQAGQSTSSDGFTTIPGAGGSTYGLDDLTVSFHCGPGGGAGGGGLVGRNTYGGNGGGIVFVCAPTIALNGTVASDGADGEDGQGSIVWTAGGAGGGSGGSVCLRAGEFSGTGDISAVGGNGGLGGSLLVDTGRGGNGGKGRVRIDGPGYEAFTISSGSTYYGPAPYTPPTPTPKPPTTGIETWWDLYE